LLTTLRADKLQQTFYFFNNDARTVDVSCGDGMFSFISMGGNVSRDTDMFRSLNIKGKFREGDEDHFDNYDKDYFVEITKKPEQSFEYGTDWKPNLLSKASHLGFYSELIEHDNDNPLPFEDESMEYVYTNSAYWVEKFRYHLQDLVRITEKRGKFVLHMKDMSIKRYKSSEYAPFMGGRFHEIIDAGRLETSRGLKSREEIFQILEDLDNCHIQETSPIYGGLPVKMWDIGLRPLFSPLSKLANGVSPETRREVKDEWCAIFYELFEEYLTQYNASAEDAIENQIILEKE
jgi:hypothetical protein